MENTKHTPGPWKILTKDGAASVVIVDCDPNFGHKIADCTTQMRTLAKQQANARLIAAAPETAAERDRLAAENKELRAAYHELCILHEPKGINRLIQCLGRHDWGLVGNEGVHEEWKNALPNKLWEYMAGACPVVAMNADESAAVIKEYDVGIVVGSLEELAERWKEHREKRQNVIKRRREFEMENHIHLVENLYKQLTGKTASMTVVPMGGQPVVRAV